MWIGAVTLCVGVFVVAAGLSAHDARDITRLVLGIAGTGTIMSGFMLMATTALCRTLRSRKP